MLEAAYRPVRVPLFARVEAQGTTLLSRNLSEGGLYVDAPDLDEDAIGLGQELALAFPLPDGGPTVEVAAHIAWIDPASRRRGTLGLGLRFTDLQARTATRLRRFVSGFRYRVVLAGFGDPPLARRALDDLFEVVEISDPDELVSAAEAGNVGAVLVGERHGAGRARARLERLLAHGPSQAPPLVYCSAGVRPDLRDLLTGHPRVSFARTPIEAVALRNRVQQVVRAHALSLENELLDGELRRALDRIRREAPAVRRKVQLRTAGLVGESEAMAAVHEAIERVAPFSTSVIVTGETGTGKEIVARAIHASSSRAKAPFVAQNCAALSETLLDAELFGNARGAYTGAMQERAGLFEAADGGTVLLDEIGEMSQAMQAKLLRVLQDGEVRRVGETRTRKVDVRILCATHRDLEALVREGSFREDLLYRLRTFVVQLPPLRQRRDDIAPLAQHFLERWIERHGREVRGFTEGALALLAEQPWPGNVRELEHSVERLVLLCDVGELIGVELVRAALGIEADAEGDETGGLDEAVEAYERRIILRELERAGGVIARAARSLGVERTTLSRRCKRLGIRLGGSEG